MAGIYVHIPFCRRKCYYCDFYSTGSRQAPWEEFAQALIREAQTRKWEWEQAKACAAGHADTLYIGGGTPSQMPPGVLVNVVEGVCDAFSGLDPVEVTVEVNPEDVSKGLAESLRGCGVNRVSMGVQSLCDRELAAIGRRHTAERALRAYETLRGVFADISVDLMFGLPLQTLESWRRSVEGVLALRPEHLSAYSLMWEERTALCKMRALGRAEECSEDLSEDMYRLLTESIGEAGYEHYEISNYCLPGHRSRHNSAYWTGAPYIGLGPGAHSYDGERRRRSNPADTARYIRHFSGAGSLSQDFAEEEHLSDEELREEYIMTRLRRCEGIRIEEYGARFGAEARARLERDARRNAGLLCVEDGCVRLSREAVMRSDSAILALL